MANYVSTALKSWATYPSFTNAATGFAISQAEGLAAAGAVGYASGSVKAGIYTYLAATSLRLIQRVIGYKDVDDEPSSWS
jgi:hypothetical protein